MKLKNKLIELNPCFSEETLNNMICTYKRGYIIYPMDIIVIDDAVFHKEAVLDDFSSIHEIRTFMFEGMRPYYSISEIDFIVYESDIFSSEEGLSIEDKIYTSRFISDCINSIYGENITKPKYELNSDTIFYGYDGLVFNKITGIAVYVNMNFVDIGRSVKDKKECDIKLCIQNEDEIILYYIHQSFKDNKPIWTIVKTNNEVWRLNDEVLKLENNNVTYKLKPEK